MVEGEKTLNREHTSGQAKSGKSDLANSGTQRPGDRHLILLRAFKCCSFFPLVYILFYSIVIFIAAAVCVSIGGWPRGSCCCIGTKAGGEKGFQLPWA